MAVRSLAQSSLVEPFTTNSMLAGYSGNDFHHLETVRLSSTASTVEFSNLARYSDFQHLQLRVVANCTTSASNQYLRFNGVSTNGSYYWHYLTANGTSVSSGAAFNSNMINFIICNADASNFTGAVVDILDPFDTTKNTTTRSFFGSARSGNNWLDLDSGLFLSTAAINSIQLGFGQSWIAGSRFSLYGLKSRS